MDGETKDMDQQLTEATLAKTVAEAAKALAETEKLRRESFFYPLVVGAGIMGAGVAFAKLFL